MFTSNIEVSAGDGHFTASAVKMQGQASAVVHQEERTAVLGSLVNGAEAEFMAYAVSGTHQLCSILVCELVGFFEFCHSGCHIYGLGKPVGDVLSV